MSNSVSRDQTVIELNKRKIALIVVGSCVLVAIGLWLLSLDDATIRSTPRLRSPMLVHGVAFFAIFFFGLCGVLALPKLLSKRAGLVFSAAGIVDNASAVSAGFIPWNEIIGTKTYDVQKQNFVLVEVKDPRKYLGRGNWLKRLALQANYELCGSCITIPALMLNSSVAEVLSILRQYQSKYGSGKQGDDGAAVFRNARF